VVAPAAAAEGEELVEAAADAVLGFAAALEVATVLDGAEALDAAALLEAAAEVDAVTAAVPPQPARMSTRERTGRMTRPQRSRGGTRTRRTPSNEWRTI
jgi:hypothetical protein